jgi:PST family polysaccharide transporter
MQLIAQLVLAWLLSPMDFGKIGLAYTITSFANLIVNPGVDDVMIQRRRQLLLWATPAFWLSLTLGMAGGIVMLIAAPLGVFLYREPQLYGLISILAVAAPIGATSLVPTAVLKASLRFRLLSSLGTVELVSSQFLTILFAWSGFGVYSFVLPIPLTTTVRSAVVWMIVRPRVRLRPQLGRWWFLLSNVSLLLGNRLVTTGIAQGDYVLLGLIAPEAIVGAYFFAYSLASLPMRIITGDLTQVIYPTLVQLAGDRARQRRAALRASRVLTFTIVPLCFLGAALCRPLLHWLFEEKWDAAIPMVQILSVGMAFAPLTWVAGSVLQAKGQFARQLTYSCVAALTFLCFILIGGLTGGALGVAIGVAMYYVLAGPFYFFFALREDGIGWRQLAELFLAPVALAAVAVGLADMVSNLLLATNSADLLRIAMVTLFSTVLYAPVAYWLIPDVRLLISNRLRTSGYPTAG